MSSENYAQIRKGGSLLLAWRIENKRVLIVGGGNVAAGRIVKTLEADANVTVVCPDDGLNDEVRYRINQNQVHNWINRNFEECDLENVDMVLTAIDDHVRSREIYYMCKARKIPVNVADVPSLCDFYFMAEHRDGPLQIGISSNGQAPKLATMIRQRVADALPENIGMAISKVGNLRQKLRDIDSDYESSKKRMGWMIRVCKEWSLNELANLDDKMTDLLLSFYSKDEVPSFNSIVKVARSTEDVNKDEEKRARSRIILVGAGPGDPSLLTIKAMTLLSQADLILSDRLVPAAILEYAKGEVRFASAKSGSEKTCSSDVSQDELLNWALEALEAGKLVVRLKVGDPFLFGRGGEEVLFFKKRGWDVEVVPGISSSLSAPLAAHIPVTHRGISDQVLITTGQGTKGRMPEIPEYNPMRTTVVLMAVGKAKNLSELLLDRAYPSDLPAMFVENGHRPNEKIVRATVGDLGEIVERENVVSPATLVIGRAVDALLIDEEQQG
ncbi:5755_t:CDS:1 [Paraglomus brasilianum]|uniref:5755_t:CDS:1 n=1 Tax=Paraglomus brasilianum TaxID=144538 RepID=A0A9N9CAW2_9GLOM|nr:5755_t:CDS:1 [Paraglomus brasilianum]